MFSLLNKTSGRCDGSKINSGIVMNKGLLPYGFKDIVNEKSIFCLRELHENISYCIQNNETKSIWKSLQIWDVKRVRAGLANVPGKIGEFELHEKNAYGGRKEECYILLDYPLIDNPGAPIRNNDFEVRNYDFEYLHARFEFLESRISESEKENVLKLFASVNDELNFLHLKIKAKRLAMATIVMSVSIIVLVVAGVFLVKNGKFL